MSNDTMRGKAKIKVIEDFAPFHPPITYVNEYLVNKLIEIVQDDRFYRGANWFDKIDEAITAIREGEG